MTVINNPEDRAKLKHLKDEAVRVLQEIQDLRGGLRDTVKAVAEELELQPKTLNLMIKYAFKESQRGGAIEGDEELLEEVKQLLHSAGVLN